ncbi:hypothetical protein [uncultured Streptococcus sp.]|uniref:hypothetical protein n=1 Tax=uncultured Streptococcus sp. TaxID=83427 RepID=UPI00280BEB5E|nr:hypothetical protein [uncultured Streptococcus sp.]
MQCIHFPLPSSFFSLHSSLFILHSSFFILHSSLYKILLPFPVISFRRIWAEMRHVFSDNYKTEEYQKHKADAVTALWHRDLSLSIARPNLCRIVIRV